VNDQHGHNWRGVGHDVACWGCGTSPISERASQACPYRRYQPQSPSEFVSRALLVFAIGAAILMATTVVTDWLTGVIGTR